MLDVVKPRVLQLGPALDVRGGVAAVERLIVENLAGRIAIRHVPTMDDGSLLRKAKVFARAIVALQEGLSTPGPLVVHIHFASRGSTLRKTILAWMTLRAGRPLILHAHGAVFDRFYAGLPRALQDLLRNTFGRADCFVTLSRQWKQFYVSSCELQPARVTVLRNPVCLPPEAPDRRARARVQFLFLGRIGERKGAFDLLRAFTALPESVRPRARLVVAGDGEVEALRRLAQPCGDSVTVLPWVDARRRDALLTGSDVFALPSYGEGVPMAMLEAMAYGLPVISTPVGGIPDVVDEGVEGLLVNPGDVGQLSRAMSRMVTDHMYRRELGRRARERAREFDIRTYVGNLLDLYHRLTL